MNELIPINYSGEEPTVSARDLHAGLEITDRFSRWFERMSAYGFAEGNDFTSVKTSTLVNNGAEREITDYQISVDMAKQICMIQRSEKRQTVPTVFFRFGKSLEHAGTGICQSIEDGGPDYCEAERYK